MPIKDLIADAKQRMHASVETVRRELAAMRTGRASLSMLDGIRVDYYGTPTPLNQVGNLSTPDPTLITIQPWDAVAAPGDREGHPHVRPRPQPAERRQDHPHPRPAAHRGAAQDPGEARPQARRGGPGGHPQRAPRRQRPPEEAAEGPRGQRGRREAGHGRGPEADRPAHRADQRDPEEEGSRRSWRSRAVPSAVRQSSVAPYNRARARHPPRLHALRARATRPGRSCNLCECGGAALRPLRPRARGQGHAPGPPRPARAHALALRRRAARRQPGPPGQPGRGLHARCCARPPPGRAASACPASSSRTRAATPRAPSRPAACRLAVSMAKALGATDVCLPSAGNAGSALAAYAARGGLQGPRLRAQGRRAASS